MSKQNMTVKPGFTPIPVGAIVQIIKSYNSWMLLGLWEVIGYENIHREDTFIGPLTRLKLKSWPTERFFCFSVEFPFDVIVVQPTETLSTGEKHDDRK